MKTLALLMIVGLCAAGWSDGEEKAGSPVPAGKETTQPPKVEQDGQRLVHEGIVNGPVDQVWAAFTTKAGLESSMVAHAEIELKIGGTMKTQYDPKGTTDDATAITNTILSYEPLRMLSFKVTKAPVGFPFPNAIAKMWTVVYFEAAGEKSTRVREVCMGFGADDESTKMREFFNRGNAITLERLQKRFAAKQDGKSPGPALGRPVFVSSE